MQDRRTRGLTIVAAIVATLALVAVLLLNDPFDNTPPPAAPPTLAPPIPALVDPEPPRTEAAEGFEAPPDASDAEQPDAAPPPTITGRVTDLVDRPLADAAVSVYVADDDAPTESLFDLWFRIESIREAVAIARTDKDGTFTLPALPTGRYDVVTRAKNFVRDTLAIELTEALPGGALSIRLEAGTGLAGRVIQPDGRPIADASVYARAAGTPEHAPFEAWRRTDDKGRFTFDSLPDGRLWTIRTRTPGRVARTIRDVTLPQPALDVIIEQGTRYEVRVIEAGMLEPLAARVLVRAGADVVGAGETDQDGLFAFHAVPDLPVTVHVEADDYPPTLDEARKLPAPTERLEYGLAAGRAVTGVVIDRSTRQGIPGAEVRIEHTEHAGVLPARWQEVDRHGVFHVKGYAGGGLQLAGYAEGFVAGRADETVVITGWPSGDMTVELSSGGVVRGRVSGPRGLGLPDVDLRVVTSAGIADGVPRTKADGSFELRALPLKQAFRIVAWRDDLGYGVSETFTLSNRFESPRAEIRLAGLSPLRGFVRDTLGAGLAGSRVTIETIENEPLIIGTTTTDRSGAFRLPGLSVSRLRVVARLAGRHAANRMVYAEAGAFPEVLLTLPEKTSIAGTVYDAGGAPATDVELIATGGSGQPAGRGRTNLEGRFTIPGLGAGVYRVIARSATGHRGEARVNAGTDYATLRLSAAPVADDEANR